ncbi:MAG: class I SAM-dependent methyltransferase [Candidatus Competibacteraceae bacterium]
MQDYRIHIYEHYASNFHNASTDFDFDVASRWAKGYDYYLRDWLPAGKEANIVDVACGSGKLLHFFKQRGYTRVTGVDISLEQVNLARQVIHDVTEANAVDFLESHKNTFDLITGLDIVEHFKKDEVLRFLNACYDALQNGGRLILQTPNAESPWCSYYRYGDFTHETAFTPNLLTYLLRLYGFQDIEAREQGPVPWGYSLKSTIRFAVWQFIRLMLSIWNLAEIGTVSNRIFTRVFIISAIKK